jgi:hypothetical protein
MHMQVIVVVVVAAAAASFKANISDNSSFSAAVSFKRTSELKGKRWARGVDLVTFIMSMEWSCLDVIK